MATTTKRTLPIGLNRISWKLESTHPADFVFIPLPIGLNRISWKQDEPGLI